MTAVVDASLVLEILLQTRSGSRLAARLLDGSASWHCPHLLDVEVSHALRRYARSSAIDAERGSQALQDLVDLPLTRYAHEPLLPRMWQLRDNVTAYDASYLALAEALDVPLLTRDRRLRSAPGHSATVEVC